MTRIPGIPRIPRQGGEGPGEPGKAAPAEPSDGELVGRVRGGHDESFVVLYERHFESARRLAGLYANSPADAEDIASEGFTQVLGAIRAGGGPHTAFRPYVLTVVRRLAASDAARGKRATPTPEMEAYAPLLPFEDPVLAELEASLVGRAFAALPERWQAVLWHTEVEGESPAQVAPRLGMSANAVAALACRAREGLRKEYLQAHLSEQEIEQRMERECRRCARKLAAYLRGSLGPRDRRRVEEHLDACDRCARLLLELREVSGGLRGILAPLVLGPVFAGYFSSLMEASPDGTAEGTADGAEAAPGGGPTRGDGQTPSNGGELGHGTGRRFGHDGGAGSAGPGTVAALLTVVAGLAVLTVAAALTLSPGSSSRPRAHGGAPTAAPAPAPRQPTPSGRPAAPSSGSPSTESPSSNRPVRPGSGASPDPSSGTSGASGTSGPSGAGGAPSAPQDRPTNSPHPSPGSVLADGGFESPVMGSPVAYYRAGDAIGPWQVVQGSVNLVRSDALHARDGKQSVDLNGDPPGATAGVIAQTFATTPGRPYTVSFSLAGNLTCAPSVKTVGLQAETVKRDFSFDITGHSASDMGWRPETVRFTATSDRTTLRLTSTTDPSSRCGPEIDSLKVVRA
ncbi:sigma-70 family RNA polymerase sigma factor [Streptomyces sioyaensis]|uniref:sigma-70 family RNA polymerase sigma factor n=1 Tax=Streptomyces sioyaensis TaxID=67364 RepID=UPI00378B30CC